MLSGWVDCEVEWDDDRLDVALLRVVGELPPGWPRPEAPGGVAAEVGEQALEAEAVGFPDLTMNPDGTRKPEQPPGVLQPAPAVRDEGNSMPFDVDTSHPGNAALWLGISGGPVRERVPGPDARLVGVVVRAEPRHQQRRLYVVALEEFAAEPRFRKAAARVGWDVVVESRLAPLWRRIVRITALAPEGVPPPATAVDDLAVFGVKAAVADDGGGSAYPPYLRRRADADLEAALDEAAAGRRRLVLVSGDAAAGKTRSAAEAVRHHLHLRTYPVVVPFTDRGLRNLLDSGVSLDHTLVWVDDIDKHLVHTSPEVVRTLLDGWSSAVIVATIRTEHLRGTGERTLTSPVQEMLTDSSLVRRV